MQVRAVSRHVRLSAYKCRLVADQIRRMPVEGARDVLNFSTKKAAKLMLKTLDSAIANAEENKGAEIDELIVSETYVDEGTPMKRIKARARGRANRILKRSCHITVVLSDKKG